MFKVSGNTGTQREAETKNIPHFFWELEDGWQIIYFDKAGNRIGDVVQNRYSYGLEAMGFDIPKCDVEGYLSVKAAFEKIYEVYRKEKREWKN